MSLLGKKPQVKRLSQEGDNVIVRDEADKPVMRFNPYTGKQVAITTPAPKKADPPKVKQTWRQFVNKITNDGEDLYVTMNNLSQGLPIIRTLPDGRQSEPILPTPEVMRAATQWLIEHLHGKAVAQSEVSKSMEDQVKSRQLEAMSDAELDAYERELDRSLEAEYKVLE